MELMRKCDVTVQKILYANSESAYHVFKGTVLRWSKIKGKFIETRESHIFVGYFFCLFLGDRLEVEIEEIFHPTYGSQYNVVNSKRAEQGTLAETRVFLTKNVKGMTQKRADKILEEYGLNAIKEICGNPNALTAIGIAPDIAAKLRNGLLENQEFERVLAFLSWNKVDCRLAMPLFHEYRNLTVSVLEGDPYAPYMKGLYDFRTADKLYLALGKHPDGDNRCKYTTLATIRMDSAMNGNVFTERATQKERMACFLTETYKKEDMSGFPFTDLSISNALASLENLGVIIMDQSFGTEAIYLRENYYDERRISEMLNELMTEPKRVAYHTLTINKFLDDYEARTHFTLAKEQKDAVRTMLTSPVCVLSGGPGTGKSVTISAAMAAIRELTPDAAIRACAPTGKAAIRISELTNIGASTIHRALNIGNYRQQLRSGELSCDFLFVDEFSMADINICAKLFQAIDKGGRVVLVGDYDQLPSVGPGLVLRDLIQSGTVPKVILKQVFRQARDSRIITNAHRIINHKAGDDLLLRIAKKPGEDFYFIEETDPQKIQRLIKASIVAIGKRMHLGPEAIQILSPVRGGDLGVENLNLVLQDFLNKSPVSVEFEDKEFRLNDKVIHVQNDYKLNVYNGEIGTVSEIAYRKDHMLKVSYPDRDVWYSFAQLEELELAYTLTVHKMQGSEYPVIIMPVHEMQGYGLSKNLLYTALTRAKKMVVLIGSKSAFSAGIRRETVIERKSNLIERMQVVLPQKY